MQEAKLENLAKFNVEKGKVTAGVSRKRKHTETTKVAQDVATVTEVVLATSVGQTLVAEEVVVFNKVASLDLAIVATLYNLCGRGDILSDFHCLGMFSLTATPTPIFPFSMLNLTFKVLQFCFLVKVANDKKLVTRTQIKKLQSAVLMVDSNSKRLLLMSVFD
ncbi:hypothetical protein VNO78_15143 [Psophocarpus tetragonolobus]|uniref:Uncharacterized protein n=1 Tax=Psophocarpus tetragonolobus TaxID=3891 RepID=A0AAN9SET1_PSOTE